MLSPNSRRSVDSLSPTSPKTVRSEFYPRAGAGGRFQTQRSSVTSSSNANSIKPDPTANWHGLAESGQNSIYTLLQSPIIRSGSIAQTSLLASNLNRVPTSRDIPPVTLSPIPKYDVSELEPYMDKVGALYGALQRANENEEDDGAISNKSSRSDIGADDLEHILRFSGSGRSNNSRQMSMTSPIETIRKRSSAVRRAAHTVTPLTTVPSVFFEEDFHLENPRTFDVVSERSELVKSVQTDTDEQKSSSMNSPMPRKALTSNAILQEKLSWYMDTIEIHLVNSISSASKSFFAALGSLRELHLETSMSVNRIKLLRKELFSLDEDIVISGLKLVNMKQRRDNLKKFSDTILQLQNIVDSITTCESLITNGEVEKALDSIDSMESLVSGEKVSNSSSNYEAIQDLRGAASLENLTTNIDKLRHRIGKVFETRFLNLLTNDLRQYVESVSPSSTLQRWNLSSQRSRGHYREHSSPAYMTVKTEFRSELLAVLIGLNRARYTSPAIATYRSSVLKEVRNTIRRQLPASSDDDIESINSTSTVSGSKSRTQQEKMLTLARNLRSLEAEEAEELLKKVYVGIGETLRRIGTQEKVLLDIISTFAENKSLNSPQSPATESVDDRLDRGQTKNFINHETQEEIHLSFNMSDLIGQAVDISQDKITKLLRVRSEQTNRLSVDNFLRYFTLNLLFTNECEAVSGRSGTLLKNLVNGHIKDYARQLGESQRQSLATGMEADNWNARDFTEEDSKILSCVISSSTKDVSSWTACNYLDVSTPNNSNPETKESNSNIDTENNTNKDQNKTVSSKTSSRLATIESQSFILPNSAVLCLYGLSTLLHFNTGLPSMTSEIASSILSYLTLFNSRCTQLILGAGATRSAGLKNITTKHLALASQALSFISTLIPYIQEFVRRHVPTSNTTLINEFDKVKRVYNEHQKSICDKLVGIMAGRTTAHTKSMRLIDWSKEKDGVNTYMETLTKETSTLYRVLNKHLPEDTVRMIMRSVLENYKEQWIKAFSEVSLVSERAKERMLRDAEWFKTKIGDLDNSGDVGDSLVKHVKDKEVIIKSVSAALSGLSKNSRQTSILEKSEAEKKDESKTEDKEIKETVSTE